ncbi:MAG: ATP-dependent DNA ligase [Luteitalea sp.]|nr:ATP-dependent DNA ligase [Luteitalea sp.]
MLLGDVVQTSGRVAATRSRSEKVAHLADLLRRLVPEEIDIAVAYLSGRLRQGPIGLGWATIRDARGASAADASSLTLVEVDHAFARLAGTTGRGSATERARQLGALFARAVASEQEFLARLIVGELRQGALAGVMEEALAKAAGVEASAVRRALLLAGDLQAVSRTLLVEGRQGLARFSLQLLRPLQPMLAQPAETLEEAFARLGEAELEWKLDGARVQVHRVNDEVRVFSRRLNDVTAAVPELVEAVRALPADQLLLDGEVIALRPDGSPHPFQVTMRRFGRKLDVDRLRSELPLSPFFFDLLHLDGKDLLDQPAAERSRALRTLAATEIVVPHMITVDEDAARAFLDQALARGHEGLMAKAPGSPYEAGRRGSAWLKVKAAQTLDLVVLAAEWGHGRRRGWLSNLHLGARDPATNSYVMLGKTFKGMTDQMLAWQTQKLLDLEMARDQWTVYVRPELVVEIAFNGVQESSHYPGGVALRFARVKRYRTDKGVEDADTIETVRKTGARGLRQPLDLAPDPWHL